MLTILMFSCKSAEMPSDPQQAHEVHNEIDRLIVMMPASEPDEEVWLMEQLQRTGSDGIRVLAGMLKAPGTGDDTYARYALSSLAEYVSRPGAETERMTFERAILNEIKKPYSAEAKTFLINQLMLTGSDRSVPVLEPYLTDDRLNKPVIDVFVTLRTTRTVRALRESILDADEVNRNALIKALGEVQDSEAVGILRAFASDENWQTKRLALNTLANIGSPEARDVFEQAYETSERSNRREIVSIYLKFANRLANEGHHRISKEICRQFLYSDYPPDVRTAALSTLFFMEGRQISDELLELAVSSDTRLAASALSRLNSLEGEDITGALMSALKQSPDSRKSKVIIELGERGDTSIVSELEPFLNNPSGQIRVAAAGALFRLTGRNYLSAILEVLNNAEDEEEIKALESILLQMPTDDLITASAELLPTAKEIARPALVRILARRNASGHIDRVIQQADSESKAVRLEVYRFLQKMGSTENIQQLADHIAEDKEEDEIIVIQNAIVEIHNRMKEKAKRDEVLLAVFEELSDEKKPYLLEIFPQLDSEEILHAINRSLTHSENSIRKAAIRALAEWPDPQALPVLLDAVSVADGPELPEVYNGYVRLVRLSGVSMDEKVSRLRGLVETAGSPRQKAEIIRHFSKAGELLALQAAGSYFTNRDETIQQSALKVAAGVLVQAYEPASDQVNSSSAVLATLDSTLRPLLLKQLENILQEKTENGEPDSRENLQGEKLSQPEPKFGQIFNGRNLNGWQVIEGDPDGWSSHNGILYTDGVGSGWLSTTSMYDNFRLQLEFRVPEGGNSGVFIRAPHEGHPSWDGMEIQILDDYADRYSDLKPWQYTGSIYGVQAPSKRFTKPAGTWQRLVIEADGPNIRITLNGEQIIQTSLIHHMEMANEHQGLVRRKGYIGLQNHSTRVEFRNIVIREIR